MLVFVAVAGVAVVAVEVVAVVVEIVFDVWSSFLKSGLYGLELLHQCCVKLYPEVEWKQGGDGRKLQLKHAYLCSVRFASANPFSLVP